MFALGMHFRREKERQEAEKRKARVAAERTRKKTLDGTEASRNRQSFGNDAKQTTTTTNVTQRARDRSNSTTAKRNSYPASGTRAATIDTADDFGKMDLNGGGPSAALTTSLYQPTTTTISTTDVDTNKLSTAENLRVPNEVKKVKKNKDSSKKQRSSSKSPKVSTKMKQESQDLADSSSSVTKNDLTTTSTNDESPLLM